MNQRHYNEPDELSSRGASFAEAEFPAIYIKQCKNKNNIEMSGCFNFIRTTLKYIE